MEDPRHTAADGGGLSRPVSDDEVAQWATDLRQRLHEKDPTILEEAQKIVYGRGEADYDHPFPNFTRIGTLWSVVFGHEVSPEQVAMCMILIKIAREVHHPQRDNRIDMAGYAETLERVHRRRDGQE